MNFHGPLIGPDDPDYDDVRVDQQRNDRPPARV